MKALYLDDQLHRRLKLLAAQRGRSLKEVVATLLERALAAEEAGPEVTTAEIQALASHGGSFDFWSDDREDVYSLLDGEAIE